MSLRSRAANTALFKPRRTTVGTDSSTPRQSVEMHEAIEKIPKSQQMLEKMKKILAQHQLGRASATSARLSGASTPRRSRGLEGDMSSQIDLLPRTPPPATICTDQSAASNAPAAAVMERPARGRVAIRMQLMMQLLEQEEDTRYRILCRQSEEWIRITQYNSTTLTLSQEQILEEVRIQAGIEIAANTALPRDSVPYNPPGEEEAEAIRAELANMQPKELRGLLRQSGQNPSGCEKTMRERLYQLMACGAIEPLQVSIQMKTECASPPRRSYRKHKNEESVAQAPLRTSKAPSPEQPAVLFEVPSEEEVEAMRVTLNETTVKQLRVFARERRLNPAGSAADIRDRLLKLIAAGGVEPIPVTAAAAASAPEAPARPVKRHRNAESQPAQAPPAPAQAPAEAWVQQHPQPSPTDMQGMRRTLASLPARQIREKLRAAGLTPAGGERELRERLEKAVASGVAAPLAIMDESGILPTPRPAHQEGPPTPATTVAPVEATVAPVEEDTAPPSPKYARPSAEDLEEARQGITALPARLLRERLRAAGLNPAGADSKLRERLFEAIGEGMAPLLKQKTPALQQRRLSNKDRNTSSMDLGMSSEQKQPQFQQQQQQQQTGERSTEEKVRALKEMPLNQLRPLLRKSGLNPAGSGESLRSRATDALRSGDLQLDSEPTQAVPPSPVNARVRRPPGGASSVRLF